MKWQDFINLAAIRGAPRAQVELVTPVLPTGRGIYFSGTHVIGRS